MASKYVTDDGLDLDSRYLGINAKAKSAETADKVSDLVYSEITGAPTGIKCEVPIFGSLDFHNTAQTYVATTDIMLACSISANKSSSYSAAEYTVYLDDAQVGKHRSGEDGYTNGWTSGTLFLKKGQSLKYSPSYGWKTAYVNYTATPIKLA